LPGLAAFLWYLVWIACALVAVVVSRVLAPWLGGWAAIPGVAAGAFVVVAADRLAHGRDRRSSDSPTALWISRRGLASGYHQTHKLTPDGLLAGFDHDDFTPGFRESYRVHVAPEIVADVFHRLSGSEFANLAGSYTDPHVSDGFTLQITWRLEGVERSVWLANTTHPLLSPLVEACGAAYRQIDRRNARTPACRSRSRSSVGAPRSTARPHRKQEAMSLAREMPIAFARIPRLYHVDAIHLHRPDLQNLLPVQHRLDESTAVIQLLKIDRSGRLRCAACAH